MRFIRLQHTAISLLLGLTGLSVAQAENSLVSIPEHPMLSDNLVFSAGIFYARSNTAAALKPSGGGSGTIVNFEDTLNLEDRSVAPAAGIFWRASDNWRVDFEYFDISRDASRTLAADVQWGNQTFTAGTTVNSNFDFSDLRISAAYSFFKRQDKELGIGLGLHVAKIKAGIKSAGPGAEATDVTAPLPVVNLYGMFALTNEWAVNLRADWLSLTYGDYAGDVRNIEINAHYQVHRNVGIGLGVRSMVIDLDMDTSDWRGQTRLAFQGPTVFVTATF